MTAPPIRALIVDDEPLGRTRLRSLLGRQPDVQVVGECVEGDEAIETVARMRPDVLFLDIQMTEISGLDVAATLGDDPLPAVVFVTAHERYALEAFGVRALDYLLKPFEEERFRATLDRVRAYVAAARSRRSHEHLVAILRSLSDTPVEELERLRAPDMPLRFADLELDPATHDVRRAGRPDRAPPEGVRPAARARRPRRRRRDPSRAAGGGVGLQGRRQQPDRGHPRRRPPPQARPRGRRTRLHPDGRKDRLSPEGVATERESHVERTAFTTKARRARRSTKPHHHPHNSFVGAGSGFVLLRALRVFVVYHHAPELSRSRP